MRSNRNLDFRESDLKLQTLSFPESLFTKIGSQPEKTPDEIAHSATDPTKKWYLNDVVPTRKKSIERHTSLCTKGSHGRFIWHRQIPQFSSVHHSLPFVQVWPKKKPHWCILPPKTPIKSQVPLKRLSKKKLSIKKLNITQRKTTTRTTTTTTNTNNYNKYNSNFPKKETSTPPPKKKQRRQVRLFDFRIHLWYRQLHRPPMTCRSTRRAWRSRGTAGIGDHGYHRGEGWQGASGLEDDPEGLILMIGTFKVFIDVPGTCLSSICGQPSKTRPNFHKKQW